MKVLSDMNDCLYDLFYFLLFIVSIIDYMYVSIVKYRELIKDFNNTDNWDFDEVNTKINYIVFFLLSMASLIQFAWI